MVHKVRGELSKAVKDLNDLLEVDKYNKQAKEEVGIIDKMIKE